MEEANFIFQSLKKSDLPLLTDWLNRPHLQKWWRSGEITSEIVREKYFPRISEKDTAKPFLAYLDKKPVGYLQYYSVSGEISNWWPDEPGEGVVGMDLFLANEENLGRGLGTAMASQFVKLLLKDPKIKEIRVDPRPDNLRAIRCYEKAGFQKIAEIATPDAPAIMMVLKR